MTAKKSEVLAKLRVRVDGMLFPYDDATKDVTLDRSMMDVWKGQPGKPGECMNAVCIMRSKRKFGHKVLGASVFGSRVYIFDTPDHLIRYILSEKDTRLVNAHDEHALSQPGTLRLLAPRGHDKGGTPHGGHDTRPNPKTGADRTTGKRKKVLARGERARVIAAVGAGR